jgi:hypothetical protein
MALRAFVVRLFVLAGLLFAFVAAPPQGTAGPCAGGGTGCCVTDDGYTCCYVGYGVWQWCIVNDKGKGCQQGCIESNQ